MQERPCRGVGTGKDLPIIETSQDIGQALRLPAAHVQGETLSWQLKRRTAKAHKRAERAAGIAPGRLGRRELTVFMARMHAFQASHEAWLRTTGIDGAFLMERERAPLMARDLATLGADPADRLSYGGVPVLPHRAAGFGVLYVLDGARAGGRYIDGWLRSQPWYPPSGLRSFGAADDEAIWRGTQAALDRLAADEAAPVLDAAVATFERLERWLAAAGR